MSLSAIQNRVMSWLTPEEVHLIRSENGLALSSTLYGEQEIDLQGQPIERGIRVLEKCFLARRESHWEIKPFDSCAEWPCPYYVDKTYRLELVFCDNELMWRFCNQNLHTVSAIAADRNEPGLSEYLANAPDQEEAVRDYLSDYLIGIKKTKETLKVVELSLKQFSSLDPEVKFDRDHTAVTLVCVGRSTGLGAVMDFYKNATEEGHAMIALDRVHKGQSERLFVHITVVSKDSEPLEKGRARVEFLFRDDLNIMAQTPTWLRTSQLVSSWMADLSREKSVPFSITGIPTLKFIHWCIRGFFWVGVFELFKEKINENEAIGGYLNRKAIQLDCEGDEVENFYNCLRWNIIRLRRLGISISEDSLIMRPHSYIKKINQNLIRVSIKEEPFQMPQIQTDVFEEYFIEFRKKRALI